MSIQQGYFNRVRYILVHSLLGKIIADEPIGWMEDGNKELIRHNQYHGIFPKFSNSLKFTGSSYDYLKTAYDVYGIRANIQLIKEERHPKTDIWTRVYNGTLDFSTYSEENKTISLKYNSGGIEEKLKSRHNDEIEIERETDLYDNPLPTISTEKVQLDGRKIFLQTLFKENTNTPDIHIETFAPGMTSRKISIPIILDIQSHEEAQSVTNSIDSNSINIGDTFFLDSESSRKLRLEINLKFTPRVNQNIFFTPYLYIRLRKFSNGTNFSDSTEIFEDLVANGNIDGFEVSYSKIVQECVIEKGDSLALEFRYRIIRHTNEYVSSFFRYTNPIFTVKIEEDSFFDTSKTKVVMAHELIDRLVNITTGMKNAVYSNALGRTDIGYSEDGVNTGALTGIAHGFWIRQFDKFPLSAEEFKNNYKSMKISLKDFFESYFSIWGLGMGIEKKGYQEKIRIEKLSYFYNRNTTIKLQNKVRNIKRTIATDYFFSSVEIGYEKGGEYEEAFGLDEYNVKSTFISCIERIQNSMQIISPIRADMYGCEFARRKPKQTHLNEDTRYDQDKFIFDLKKGNSDVLNQRKWEDDFENAPTGVYDPNSATNLRLSPVNCLIRNSWYLNSGLVKYPEEKLRYASSTGNSNLKTKFIDRIEFGENEDINNSELTRPVFIPEFIEFEHIVDFEINQKLESSTNFYGEEIMNVYGCIEFINENNEKEKGFLIELKPDGNGKWKLLKAY